MKMILKVIAAPFALVLALLTALCWFLFDLCAFFLTIASVIVAVLGIGLFFTPTPLGGFVFLFLAFLLSKDRRFLWKGGKQSGDNHAPASPCRRRRNHSGGHP